MSELGRAHFDENPFYIKDRHIESKTGDLHQFLRDFFEVSPQNDTISAVRLGQYLELAEAVGMETRHAAIPLGFAFDRNWNQFKYAMNCFCRLYPSYTECIPDTWANVASLYLNGSFITEKSHQTIIEDTVNILENQFAASYDRLRLVELCCRYPDDGSRIAEKMKLKALNAIDESIAETDYDADYQSYMLWLKGNMYYRWANWDEALKAYQSMKPYPCECGGPGYPSLQIKLEICKSKIRDTLS